MATTADKTKTKNSVLASLAFFADYVLTLAATDDDRRAIASNLLSKIIRKIDDLIDTPEDLAADISELYQTVAGVVSPAVATITAMLNALENLMAQDPPDTQATAATRIMQAAAIAQSIARVAITGTIINRESAVAAAIAVASGADSVRAIIEECEDAVTGYTAPSEIVASIEAMLKKAQAYLLAAAFDLRLERSIVTDREYIPLSLIYKIYGETDIIDRGLEVVLGEFIDQNNLTDAEIFLIPIGREIKYYV
jgi:hypothetical protein